MNSARGIRIRYVSTTISYSYDFLFQSYDQVAVAEICLVNSGKVGFDFTAIGMDPGMAAKPKPGVPVMTPHAVSKYIDIDNLM